MDKTKIEAEFNGTYQKCVESGQRLPQRTIAKAVDLLGEEQTHRLKEEVHETDNLVDNWEMVMRWKSLIYSNQYIPLMTAIR